ncbi:MAG: trypsin-like peptidase domain-containing protein [Alphaproteobacteria bacterium]|nr:trypsin-like peptidase domain-containing protein [Alphaproteobacteria bacterium]
MILRRLASPLTARAGRTLPALMLALLVALPAPRATAQGDACAQPAPVCDARDAVFAVSSFDPIGSAVRIGETRLVTSRHVVADEKAATLFLANGQPITAEVVATDYPGDLVLLESADLPPGPSLSPAPLSPEAQLFTVAADIGSRRIRAYDPGRLHLAPPPDRPLARLHHSAYSQPGNSGGALVDEAGRLVGIVASGGEGRYEAIPADAIATLVDRSGPDAVAASAEIGAAVRICTTLLEDNRSPGQRLEDQQAKAIATACRRSGNRQLLDLAGQTLARAGRAEAAVGLFEQGLEEDPNAINTRIGLVVTHHLARDFEAALPHLRWLMDQAGDDLQVLRLSIQAGVWAGDAALAERALARLKQVNPQSAPAAERFLKNPPPRPPALQ